MATEVPSAGATKKDGSSSSSNMQQESGSTSATTSNRAIPEEKKEDDKRASQNASGASSASISASSRSPKKASTPTDSILTVNMPNSMMSPTKNRPPSRSSLSVQSAGSGGARTTTSRRGGRTRSRSPTAGHNIHSATTASGLPPYGGRPSSTTPSIPSEITHHSNVPPSPRNPSAAAAAAAAAAKSFRNPNVGMRGPGGPSSSIHPSLHYPPHQQPPPPYGSANGGPTTSMRDPYGRQGPPQGRQDPYSSSRYPGGPPPGQRPSHQRAPSSASTGYPGSQPPQRPHSRSSVSSYPGGPPPGYYDPHNGNRNPSSSSHHQYRPQHSRNSNRSGPPPSRYDPQQPTTGIGPDGRPLSRNGGPNGPTDPQNPYGYNPYHRSSGGPPPSSRGGIPPGGGRDYGSQYPGSTSTGGSGSSGRYGGPSGGGPGPPGSGGPVDTGEYGRQHHSSTSGSASSGGRHGHTPPPHHRHQYSGAGGPPPPSGHHPPTASSARGGRQTYPGSSGSSHHHTSYRHGDPNARGGPPPPHYRGGPPPPHSSHPTQHSRGGPPPGHPEYHRYHSQQQQQQQQFKQHKSGGDSMVKSTRSVMGTATPLHLNKGGPMASAPLVGPQGQKPQGYGGSNKMNDGLSSSSSSTNNMNSRRESMPPSSRRGSAASVFRGRPGPPRGSTSTGSGSHHHPGGASSSTNPKTILDSLDTPSNSFEEKKASRNEGNSQQTKDPQDQLSPEDPPKLRSAGNSGSGSGSGNADLVFDPQPSPKNQTPVTSASGGLTMSPPQLTNSLDMAPSFSLFNQSFDSLGDTAQFFNVGGALDTAMLNSSTSFELKTSGSRSPSAADHGLQLTSSNGTFKLNASMSGFGMSPTNSFGNGPTASFSTNTPGGGGGSVTILGGNSELGRSSSPSQVLDMYKSAGSIEEADLRLSASLGSPMIGASASYSSSRPFATGMEGGPPQPTLSGGDFKPSGSSSRRSHLSPRPQRHYSGQHSSSSQYRPQRTPSFGPPNKDGSPRFYSFLRRNRGAFLDLTFLLPELKTAVNELKKSNSKHVKKEKDDLEGTVSTPKRGQTSRDRRNRYDREPTKSESTISRRRIVSAVCAFGGTFIGSRMHNPTPAEGSQPDTSSSCSKTGVSKANSQSIFREKSSPATVTPNSSGASSSTPTDGEGDGIKIDPERAKYDGALPTRYYESDNRLSWEFEENPPIGGPTVENPLNFNWCQDINDDEEDKPTKKRKTGGKDQEGVSDDDDDDEEENAKEGEEEDPSKKSKSGKGESPKMRYRCKLCGQPKTNHVCPYQQSLVRNIGLMVHPAVNAFTAAEPGQLAPALTEMNNMAISAAAVQAENKVAAENGSPTRPTPDRSSARGSGGPMEGVVVSTAAAQVTPESLRGGAGPSRSPDELLTPGGRSAGTPSSISLSRRGGRSGNLGSSSSPKKRSHARMSGKSGDQTDLLFVEEMELKTEQYRTVTVSKAVTENPDAFTYPALPLPYAQRKRLSDNLFSLSKEIPQLTDECAAVLREARERDLWDLAVAELMTQVVVVVHCHDGDTCFEGLRRYLLTLGFTC